MKYLILALLLFGQQPKYNIQIYGIYADTMSEIETSINFIERYHDYKVCFEYSDFYRKLKFKLDSIQKYCDTIPKSKNHFIVVFLGNQLNKDTLCITNFDKMEINNKAFKLDTTILHLIKLQLPFSEYSNINTIQYNIKGVKDIRLQGRFRDTSTSTIRDRKSYRKKIKGK